MEYKMKIAGLERSLPLCPLSEEMNIAAFVIFGDVELTEACARELLKRAPEHDILITAESKGIPLVYEMARQEKAPHYLIARKAVKLYMRDVFSVHVRSITTAGMQTLFLDGNDKKLLEGKRVIIVDDVISTGASLKALEELVTQAGGEIVARMAILAEGEACDREDLTYLERLPLFDKDGNPID